MALNLLQLDKWLTSVAIGITENQAPHNERPPKETGPTEEQPVGVNGQQATKSILQIRRQTLIIISWGLCTIAESRKSNCSFGNVGFAELV